MPFLIFNSSFFFPWFLDVCHGSSYSKWPEREGERVVQSQKKLNVCKITGHNFYHSSLAKNNVYSYLFCLSSGANMSGRTQAQ